MRILSICAKLVLLSACFIVYAPTAFSQSISYIIPDIGASGSNTYLEIVGPYNTNGNFGTDGFYTNNPGDLVQVVCANSADSAKIKFGPVVVSWNGKMISTQVFILPGINPNSDDWQQLSSAYRIPIEVLLNGTTYSNPDTFYIVQPQPAIVVSGAAVLGSGGALGIRSRRGAMLVSSLNFQAGANVSVSTADCDPGTAGNQGFLPINVLSMGNVTIAGSATISVNAPGATNPDGGPGGGGGGTESWTNNTTCNGGANPNVAGSGFTGGGTEKYCCTETPGNGTGGVSGCLGCGYGSLNGNPGGEGGASCVDADVGAGGTGHPFGTSGVNGDNPGGEGGGSGWAAFAGGGYASAGTTLSAGSEGMINGNMELIPFAGGSGGCGGVAGPGALRGGGGGGGGALSINAFNSFNLLAAGSVQSNGGTGVNGATNYHGGPGGSGGGILLTGKLNSQGAGSVSVAGGVGGVGGTGQGGNGGAGRARVDGPFATFPAIAPVPGAGSSSNYNGPSTDTSMYVTRSFNLTGTGNGQPVNIYIKAINKQWYLAATITGYTNTWTENIILPCPDTTFLLAAAQQVTSPNTAQYTMEPQWVFSQAAANFLYTTSFFTANFIADTACLYNPTTFTDQSIGSIGPATQWHWNFGDGNASTVQNPSHIYNSSGNYTVTLIASDTADCPDTTSRLILVRALPVVNFTATTVCANQPPTLFTDQSVAAVQWNWSFGDGGSSALQNPTHAYALSGNYTATLIAADVNGCLDTSSNTVSVNPVGTASFTSTNVCYPSAMVFNNTSTGPNVAYGWSFGDGQLSTQQSPSHTYTAAGTYSVTLIAVTANGCGDTIVQTFVVNPKPVAGFKVLPVCDESTSIFIDTSSVSTGAIVSYAWSLGDGTFSLLQNPSHAYAIPGTYQVMEAIQTDSGCVDSFNSEAIVYIKPDAGFSATSPCVGNPVQYTDTTSPAGQIAAFIWSFGDGAVSPIQNPEHLYATAGNYMVREIVSTNNACTDTAH
jgi:PKD repeat protein